MIQDPRSEIILLYHSGKPEDEASRAFVESLSKKYKVKMVDLAKEFLSEAELAGLTEKMNVSAKELCATSYADGTTKELILAHIKSMTEADVLVLLNKQPNLVNTPILIIGKSAYSYQAGFELFYKNITMDGVASRSHAHAESKR